MSIALDFSEMFAPQQGKRPNGTTAPMKENSLMNAFILENSENCPPSESEQPGDSLTWVKNSLLGMNYVVKEDDISEKTIPIWQKVLTEVSTFLTQLI
jgi:hypothetical protein